MRDGRKDDLSTSFEPCRCIVQGPPILRDGRSDDLAGNFELNRYGLVVVLHAWREATSSPTLQASWPYFFLITAFNLWYTSAPMIIASLKDDAPVGRIMNSWQAKRFPA